MSEPRALRVVGGYLAVLGVLAAVAGAPPLAVFLVGYALPAAFWVLGAVPTPEPGPQGRG